ncbi:amino acid permease family protein [Mycobacterium xenopi 3993]|nr:amino acid permease family protein [Mycobacterium xenopi 3993]
MLRIAIFYVGSVLLLALLLPYTTYKEHESPFVTFFSHIGFSGAGSVMNLVVVTAAFSSLNAGLYSTGRILRSMAVNGSGPSSPRGCRKTVCHTGESCSPPPLGCSVSCSMPSSPARPSRSC